MSFFEGTTATNFGDTSPTGNFSPTIFSQRVLNFFRTSSVVEGITNTDYFGELASFGDKVNIILEPVLTVSAYTRGQTVTNEALVDNEISIEIDKANKFAFAVDDIERKLAHVNWETLATSSATYALKNSFDKEVLEFMALGAQDANIVSDDGSAVTHLTAQQISNVVELGHGTGDVDPLNLLSLLSLKLDEAEVPEEGRYVVVSPRFMELLARTDSKLLSTDYNQGEGGLKNGLVMNGKLRGFSVFKTNNVPKFTADTNANIVVDVSDDDGVIAAATEGATPNTGKLGDIIISGHMSAVATVNAIDKVEKIRLESTFGDVIRGLHVYGRAIIRAEALAVAYVTYA